jgi:hypothetical protein
MLMQALKPWVNYDREGVVEPGRQFEATELRARELELAGLAVPALANGKKVVIQVDRPAKAARKR